jgi:hypothetical protein
MVDAVVFVLVLVVSVGMLCSQSYVHSLDDERSHFALYPISLDEKDASIHVLEQDRIKILTYIFGVRRRRKHIANLWSASKIAHAVCFLTFVRCQRESVIGRLEPLRAGVPLPSPPIQRQAHE